MAKKQRSKKSRQYKSFKLTKKIKQPAKTPLPSSFRIVRDSLKLIKSNWPVFLGLLAIYLLATLILRGFDLSSGFSEIKSDIDNLVGGNASQIGTVVGLYAYAVASGGSQAGESAGAYQLFVSLTISLAAIWSVRQLLARKRIRIRDSFYQGMYPLIPFIIILFVIGLQLLPALLGSFLLSTVLSGGIAVTAVEKLLWIVVFGLLTLLSLYMICSSLFALYISTLADMTPMRALRSARGLVMYRRVSVSLLSLIHI